MEKTEKFYMERALELARKGEIKGEVPVGAVLVHKKKIAGEGYNRVITDSNPTAHAEIIALEQGGDKLDNYRLNGAVLYVTLEPCIMCYTAAVNARVKKIVYSADDPKTGIFSTGAFNKINKIFNHKIEIESGILKEESSKLLKNFFKKKRK